LYIFLFIVLDLNDGFEGGKTAFPGLSHTISPKIGEMYGWPNFLLDATTVRPGASVEEKVEHSGEKVVAGEKFCMNIWASIDKHRQHEPLCDHINIGIHNNQVSCDDWTSWCSV
jgi:hypothetical protein